MCIVVPAAERDGRRVLRRRAGTGVLRQRSACAAKRGGMSSVGEVETSKGQDNRGASCCPWGARAERHG